MKKAKYVDTSIGTVGEFDDERGHGGGKTHPGACVPGGMVQLSPDTVTGGDNGTGYNYCYDTIEGFSFNHMSGIGWYGDLGNLQIMPVTGETDLRSGSNMEIPFNKGTTGWKSAFKHENEKTLAGYYSVILDRYNILAEATVTCRSGMLRFTYPENSDAKVILNFSRRIGGKADFEKVKIVDEKTLEGSIICTPAGGGFGRGDGNISYNLHFVCEFSQVPEKMQFFSDEEFLDSSLTQAEKEDLGLLVSFGSKLSQPVCIKCAISYVDLEGAKKNFEAECKHTDFESMKKSADEEWERIFEGVDVEGSNETDLKLFYTCLYHVLLDPRTSMDTDGRFTIGEGTVWHADYTHRTVFSGWDVYRSEFPLLTLISPETVNDEVNSLMRIAEFRNTSFPRWELVGIDASCMVGDPGTIVVADAYTKGIRNYDAEKAFAIAKASVECPEELFGRKFRSIRPYCKQHSDQAYVPDKLSDTLEYLLADYTLYRFALALGKDSDAQYFLNRVKRYKENYNEALGFMAPRDSQGNFVFEENEYDDDGTVESNVFQQTWFAPYDVTGLAELFGKERTVELLERLFGKAELGNLWNDDYNHSNEPCHNITHYFDILGLPHRTQYWTRRVQKECYRTGAFGFCGNEDVGQLSAWYVLSAIGFAQVCPGNEEYYLNTPLFKKARIRLDEKYHSCLNGKHFTVECDKDPLDYPYISTVFFNGRKIDRPYLTYNEITSGGTLEINLSAEPTNAFQD